MQEGALDIRLNWSLGPFHGGSGMILAKWATHYVPSQALSQVGRAPSVLNLLATLPREERWLHLNHES